MNDQLGSDENRKCNEESDVHFDVVKEREPTEVPRPGAYGGKEQQRNPRNSTNREQPARQKF
jgi:hypothetical protein